MGKHMKRLVAALLMLVVVFISKPTTIFADTETLLKDKTNKLILGDTADENMKYIEGAADQLLTYKIEIPKGTLYIQLFDLTNFKIEIYNSKNKLVETIKAVETFGEEGAHIARGGVALSKGKYKIKISPVDKNSALNTNGTVSMIKNETSKTIIFDKNYHTAVTEGKTYKIKFEVKKEVLFSFQNHIISYDPNDFIPHTPKVKVVNSAGKTVKSFDIYNQDDFVRLKKGTYTMTLKASITGYLNTMVTQGD